MSFLASIGNVKLKSVTNPLSAAKTDAEKAADAAAKQAAATAKQAAAKAKQAAAKEEADAKAVAKAAKLANTYKVETKRGKSGDDVIVYINDSKGNKFIKKFKQNPTCDTQIQDEEDECLGVNEGKDKFIEARPNMPVENATAQYEACNADAEPVNFGNDETVAKLTADIQVLKDQLTNAGVKPLESGKLEDIEYEIKSLQGTPDADQERLIELFGIRELNPEYKKQIEAESATWKAKTAPQFKQWYDQMRTFIPSNINKKTLFDLQQSLSPDLAKRVLSTKILWLIRTDPITISRISPVDLTSKYRYDNSQKLDIVELAAIFVALPEFDTKNMDPNNLKKITWKTGLETKLKEAYIKFVAKTLPANEIRNPAYIGQTAYTKGQTADTNQAGPFVGDAGFIEENLAAIVPVPTLVASSDDATVPDTTLAASSGTASVQQSGNNASTTSTRGNVSNRYNPPANINPNITKYIAPDRKKIEYKPTETGQPQETNAIVQQSGNTASTTGKSIGQISNTYLQNLQSVNNPQSTTQVVPGQQPRQTLVKELQEKLKNRVAGGKTRKLRRKKTKKSKRKMGRK
jgi:hypothetical protein